MGEGKVVYNFATTLLPMQQQQQWRQFGVVFCAGKAIATAHSHREAKQPKPVTITKSSRIVVVSEASTPML